MRIYISNNKEQKVMNLRRSKGINRKSLNEDVRKGVNDVNTVIYVWIMEK